MFRGTYKIMNEDKKDSSLERGTAESSEILFHYLFWSRCSLRRQRWRACSCWGETPRRLPCPGLPSLWHSHHSSLHSGSSSPRLAMQSSAPWLQVMVSSCISQYSNLTTAKSYCLPGRPAQSNTTSQLLWEAFTMLQLKHSDYLYT